MSEPSSSKDVFTFPISKKQITFGRDPSCDVPLKGIGASRFHAVVNCDSSGSGVWIQDSNSSFGTRVDGVPVKKARLADGGVITAGVTRFKVAIDASTVSFFPIRELEPGSEQSVTVEARHTTTIGRDPSNEICLSHPLVSRFHATVRRAPDKRLTIEDHGSTNATFVNGTPTRKSGLYEGDIIQIGPYRLFVSNGALQQAQDFNRIKIEAFDVSVRRANRDLIGGISLSIEPGEFAAILGPSGAGKSTLANALTCQTPLASGSVFYNGLPMKRFCSAFTSAIGFVSQQNLLRPELTVRETFTEQCVLRLPADSIAAERRERIREVMDLLNLTELSGRKIANLSGGEAKRVHFGIELLSSPTIIFLDEPLAGLDPGLVSKFMALFRAICDKGHTILLTTHTLEQIDLCNRVLFVSSGSLVFSGTPREMRTTFGSSNLSEVYEKARSVRVASEPHAVGMGSARAGLRKTLGRAAPSGFSRDVKLYRPKTVSFVKQLLLLSLRYCKVCVRDWRTLALMLVQAPLIALLLSFVFEPGSSFLPLTFFFCISISVIWMGGMNSVREISREWPLIEREFRIGLSPVAYLMSKCAVFCCLAVAQALIFGGCLHAFFFDFSFTAQNATLLCAACAAGSLLGLCISGLSRNVNMAISFLPIVFIPQIFFSGILMPFDEMPALGRIISHLTVSRPVFSMFKKMSFFDQTLWRLEDWKGLFLLSTGLIILLFASIRFRHFIRGGSNNQ
jgi:ABC transport system ATP-binding/permease protein